jgi:hypothetical protein
MTPEIYEGDDGWYVQGREGEPHGPFSSYEEAADVALDLALGDTD